MKGPFRAVAKVERVKGPRGGLIWHLTLACGHLENRLGPDVRNPKRVRCWQCGVDRTEAAKDRLATDPVLKERLSTEIVQFVDRMRRP